MPGAFGPGGGPAPEARGMVVDALACLLSRGPSDVEAEDREAGSRPAALHARPLKRRALKPPPAPSRRGGPPTAEQSTDGYPFPTTLPDLPFASRIAASIPSPWASLPSSLSFLRAQGGGGSRAGRASFGPRSALGWRSQRLRARRRCAGPVTAVRTDPSSGLGRCRPGRCETPRRASWRGSPGPPRAPGRRGGGRPQPTRQTPRPRREPTCNDDPLADTL